MSRAAVRRLTRMATIVCIHGAGGRGSDWNLVGADLRALGHEVLAVDLPCEDDDAGFPEYAQAVIDQIGERRDRDDLVLVAQSLGGFTAPLVCQEVPVALMVLVAAMIPVAGESFGEWWTNTGHAEAVEAQGLDDTSEEAMFLHDVSPEVLAAADPPRDQSGELSGPWPLAAWPDVPTRFLLCTDDRFFPPEWMRGVVRDRLGIEPDEVPGGHCAYWSRPHELAAAIHRCWTEL